MFILSIIDSTLSIMTFYMIKPHERLTYGYYLLKASFIMIFIYYYIFIEIYFSYVISNKFSCE